MKGQRTNRFRSLAGVASTFAIVVAGCSEAALAPSSATNAAEKSAPTVEAKAEDLGEPCSFGSNSGILAAITGADECAEGVCLVDSRDGRRHGAYCSVDCDLKLCPAGYSCEETQLGNGVTRVCTQDPAVCADGIVQVGEACDDGNEDEDDFCSADCKTVSPPTAKVDLTKLEVDGEELLNGEVPLVFHSATSPRQCNTYLAATGKSSGTLLGFGPVLCTPSGRRFHLGLYFHQLSRDTRWGMLTMSGLDELDAQDNVIERWEIVALDGPTRATITKATTTARGRVTSASGTLSIDRVKSSSGATVTMTGTFSLSKLSDLPPE